MNTRSEPIGNTFKMPASTIRVEPMSRRESAREVMRRLATIKMKKIAPSTFPLSITKKTGGEILRTTPRSKPVKLSLITENKIANPRMVIIEIKMPASKTR